jgi:hypothetical protein
LEEERMISRLLLSQSNPLIIFNMNTPVYGPNIRYGVGDLETHFIIEDMVFLRFGRLGTFQPE